MRYYNEVRTERRIRRQAILITIVVMTLVSTSVLFLVSETARDILPDSVKELFQDENPDKSTKAPDKKA